MLLPPPQAADPPNPRLSNAHGLCRDGSYPYERSKSHSTSTPSETTPTPSAAPLTAASVRFAAIGAIFGSRASDNQQDGQHDAKRTLA